MDDYEQIDNLKCDFDFNFKRNRTIPSFSRNGSDEPNKYSKRGPDTQTTIKQLTEKELEAKIERLSRT